MISDNNNCDVNDNDVATRRCRTTKTKKKIVEKFNLKKEKTLNVNFSLTLCEK